MPKSVTMKDIAQALNISVVSVSKALTGKEGVSDELRNKIMLKAEQIGYHHKKQVSFSGESSGNIGILVCDKFFSEGAFYNNLLRGLLVRCSRKGYTGIQEIVTVEDEKNGKLPYIMFNKELRGIIMMGQLKDEYVEKIISAGLPYVLLDFWNDTYGQYSVVSDGVFGSYKLTKMLIRKGHKKISFVGNYKATSSIMDRYLGYIKALMQENIAVDMSLVVPDRDEDNNDIPLAFPKPLPDAFVCNCDQTANRLIKSLEDCNYHVPEDVSVVGFDNSKFSTISKPPLTTFSVNVEAMVDAAFTQIDRKICGKHTSPGRIVVSGKLIKRESVMEKKK